MTDTALVSPGGSTPFTDIDTVRIYSVPGLKMLGAGQVIGSMQRCVVRLKSGKLIRLSSQHFLGAGQIEDRSPALIEFANALAAHVRTTNPNARYLAGMPPALWWSWFITFGGLSLLIVLCIAFGLIGLTMEHQNTPGTFGIFLVLALMLIGPITFLRAIWRRRTRDLNSESISRAL